MNEQHQTDELIVTDVDEWLDDDELHAACAICTPKAAHAPGSLVIAFCGTLYRLKHGPTGPGGYPPGVCKTCRGTRCNHGIDA